jgi:outer membrane protein OmpA-like peptidoglycan-associated protein
MKSSLFFIFILFLGISVQAQIKVDVEKKVSREANQRANNKTDEVIDKSFDKLEEGIGNLFKKKNKKSKIVQSDESQSTQNNSNHQISKNKVEEQKPAAPQMNVQWSKFDFVPGDEIIFEDGPATDEENGEFPSRWDLVEGSVEIGQVNGHNVIMFLEKGKIIPYLKNPKEDYLPDVFTVEMDVWFEKRQSTSNRYFINLRDDKNQRNIGLNENLTVYPNGLEFQESDKRYPGTEHLGWSNEPVGRWRHIAIAFTRGKFKAYMDDTRLINVPHLEGNPSGITIYAYNDKMYIKNIRIAKGGVKYYDRVLSDGKIIVNGIRFDVNKATIKPESNGAINGIFELMQKQPELNFSVEGHTDSDGDEARNQTLSEHRAKAVMDRLIDMGISANRLKSAGWGESKPIGENGTAEGKANNRRVEFIKFEGGVSASNNTSQSIFDKLDKKTIETKLKELPQVFSIEMSNPTGIQNGAGTIILYTTSKGNVGKMEILNIDKNDNYKLTAKYITYSPNGSVYSQSNNIEVKGTYRCDLDKANTEDVSDTDEDFHWGRQDETTTVMWPGQNEKSQIRIFQY